MGSISTAISHIRKYRVRYEHWDWKGQPSWEDIAINIEAGFKFIQLVDTGGDDYCIAMTKEKVTLEEAQLLFEFTSREDGRL